MNAQLTFNLPEDNNEFRMATNGGHYLCALLEFKESLRSMIKHGYGPNIKTPTDMLEEVERRFREATEDVNFDEVQ